MDPAGLGLNICLAFWMIVFLGSFGSEESGREEDRWQDADERRARDHRRKQPDDR